MEYPIIQRMQTNLNYLKAQADQDERLKPVYERSRKVFDEMRLMPWLYPQFRSYHDYINSPEWKKRSEEAKKRADYRCQVCNERKGVQTHHRTYERLGHERDEDLIVLCDACHGKYHDLLEG